MRRMQHVLAVIAVAALGTLVAFAQAPQQPAAGAPAQGRPVGPPPDGAARRDRRRSSSPASARATAPTTAASPAPMRIARRWRPEAARHAGRTHVARVSQHAGPGWSAGGERARPHRRGTVVQRARRAHRQQRGRSARRRAARSQSDQQVERAERKDGAWSTAAATCRTSTTSSPAPTRTGGRLPATWTPPARATRAMPTAPRTA